MDDYVTDETLWQLVITNALDPEADMYGCCPESMAMLRKQHPGGGGKQAYIHRKLKPFTIRILSHTARSGNQSLFSIVRGCLFGEGYTCYDLLKVEAVGTDLDQP